MLYLINFIVKLLSTYLTVLFFQILIEYSGESILDVKLTEVFKIWESTSYELEKIQSNVVTAVEEFNSLENRLGPVYSCNFELNNPSAVPGMKNNN